jgi:hypothetical protein
VQTYTPTPASYRGRFGRILPGLLILAVLLYWRFQQPSAVFFAEMIGIIVAVGLYILLFFRNTRITAQPRSLTIRTAFGMSHTVAEHHLATAVLIENHVTSASQASAVAPRLLLLDDEGRAVLRWSGSQWSEQQMRDLVDALDISLTEIPGRLGSADIHRRYPHALGVWEAHPLLGAALLILGIVVVTVTVFTGLGGH